MGDVDNTNSDQFHKDCVISLVNTFAVYLGSRTHQIISSVALNACRQKINDLQPITKKDNDKIATAEKFLLRFAIEDLGLSDTTDIPCLLYTSPSPRDATLSRMPSSA